MHLCYCDILLGKAVSGVPSANVAMSTPSYMINQPPGFQLATYVSTLPGFAFRNIFVKSFLSFLRLLVIFQWPHLTGFPLKILLFVFCLLAFARD